MAKGRSVTKVAVRVVVLAERNANNASCKAGSVTAPACVDRSLTKCRSQLNLGVVRIEEETAFGMRDSVNLLGPANQMIVNTIKTFAMCHQPGSTLSPDGAAALVILASP